MAHPLIKRRHRKPINRTVICKLGTLAHNRAFTAQELREYTGAGATALLWLRKHGHLTKQGRSYYPTARGWNMIEKACKL